MVTKHEDLTQAEEVNDSGQKLPKVSRNDGTVFISLNAILYGHLSVYHSACSKLWLWVGLVYED